MVIFLIIVLSTAFDDECPTQEMSNGPYRKFNQIFNVYTSQQKYLHFNYLVNVTVGGL